MNTVSELYSAKIEDLLQLKRAMEDDTFNHQYNKRRLRSCVHIPSPPPETIKVHLIDNRGICLTLPAGLESNFHPAETVRGTV